MEIMDILRKTFLQGYATSDIGVSTIFVCILCTAFIGAYIFVIYKNINKNSFYNRNFNLSLMGMAIITAAIILTIQSNIVVSLGMVGALSIIRFRTAIKDPMDLVILVYQCGNYLRRRICADCGHSLSCPDCCHRNLFHDAGV